MLIIYSYYYSFSLLYSIVCVLFLPERTRLEQLTVLFSNILFILILFLFKCYNMIFIYLLLPERTHSEQLTELFYIIFEYYR